MDGDDDRAPAWVRRYVRNIVMLLLAIGVVGALAYGYISSTRSNDRKTHDRICQIVPSDC